MQEKRGERVCVGGLLPSQPRVPEVQPMGLLVDKQAIEGQSIVVPLKTVVVLPQAAQ